MPTPITLTPDDIEDIRTLLPVHGARYVAEYIGCSTSSVRRHARTLGLSLPTRQPLAEDLADLARLLPAHGAGYVAEHLGWSGSKVRWHARYSLGITEWPQRPGQRGPAISERDVPGVSKVCLGCGESKPLDQYHRHKVGRFGRRPRCIECSR